MIARAPRRLWELTIQGVPMGHLESEKVTFQTVTITILARTFGHAARLASRALGVQLFTDPETFGFRTIIQHKPRVWAGVEGAPCSLP